MAAPYSLEEQETIIRFDRTDALAMLYTAAPAQAERWRKLGYTVEQSGSHGWKARIPKAAVKFRRLHNGQLEKRAPTEAFLEMARRKKDSHTTAWVKRQT